MDHSKTYYQWSFPESVTIFKVCTFEQVHIVMGNLIKDEVEEWGSQEMTDVYAEAFTVELAIKVTSIP